LSVPTPTQSRLLAEIRSLITDEYLLAWAKDGLIRKNTLLEADALAVEVAYQQRLREAAIPESEMTDHDSQTDADIIAHQIPEAARGGHAFPKEPVRKRSKAHLLFVRGQPCVVRQQSPCGPHHLKFAQAKALSRKVSDEFTVPLCPAHHQDLHRHGNEKAWWTNLQIAPLPIARALWEASPIQAAGRNTQKI
jgi:hypothetical protein